MAAGIDGKYYVRLDVGEQTDVFDIESFLSYKIVESAGGVLPLLVIEFVASGELSSLLKAELREDTKIVLFEGIDAANATRSEWTAANPAYKNFNSFAEFRIECASFSPGYNTTNLTESFTGTSVDVIADMAGKYLLRGVDSNASPSDSMNWALGLTTPQEQMTRAQVRYWSDAESPNTCLAIAIPREGDVIVRDLAVALKEDPKWDFYYQGEPSAGITGVAVMSNYVVYAHNALQSRIGGVNRAAGMLTIDEAGETGVSIDRLDGLESPFKGTRFQSFTTYDKTLSGRLDWKNYQDNLNVHAKWSLAKNVNLAQLARVTDVSVVVTVPSNASELSLLDTVFFKERDSQGEILEAFSGKYFITTIERGFNPSEQSVTSSVVLNRDGA